MAPLIEVDEFLYTFKQLKNKHGLIILDREKNLQALLDMEVTPQKREAVIMGLKPRDYIRGPRLDEVHQGFEFWEFGKQMDLYGKTFMVYIKLSIRFAKMPVICMSFHPAERTMTFPYKNA